MVKALIATPDPEEPNGSPFDAIRQFDADGEYWTGRMLMPLMSYSQWAKFAAVIEKAKASLALVQGEAAARNHFSQTGNMVRIGSGAERRAQNYRLTRFGAYLVAMAGDDTKEAVAQARVYFAVRAREAEVQAERPMTELELAKRYIRALEREQRLVAFNGQLASRVAELGPKAEGYDDLIAADGLLDLAAVAKLLAPVTNGLGRTRFINLLRGMGIILQHSTLPYQHLIDRGYFAVRTEIKDTGAYAYTVVTAKGLRWLHAELREERPTFDHGDTVKPQADGPNRDGDRS